MVKVNAVHYKLLDGYVYYCVFCYNEDFNKNLPTEYSEEEGDDYLCYTCEQNGERVQMKSVEEAHQHYLDRHQR